MVVRLRDGAPIAGHAADRRLIPASLSKLFVAVAALEHFGPEHRFRTGLHARTAPDDGILSGDLLFRGSGDPDLGTEQLRTLVARLRQAGVQRITGALIIDEGRFGAIACRTKDRCDARTGSRFAFDGPLSAAGIDHGTVEIAVRPASRPGQPASVALMPPSISGIALTGSVETLPADARLRFRVERRTDADGNDVLGLDGGIPLGHATVRRSRSVSNAARHTGRVLRALLRDAGIALEGGVRIASLDAPGDDWRLLAAIDGTPLAAQLRRMLHFSNNYMADMLTLHLTHGATGSTDLDVAGMRLLTALDMAPAGDAPEAGPILHSGSGLSVSSRLSARQVVAVLARAYRRHALFPALLGGLTVPLYADSGQLDGGSAAWNTRLAVKTGWLSEPVGVRALAGYLRLSDDDWGAFAVIVNGTSRHPRVPRTATLTALRQDLEALLSSSGSGE
ncbi:D-alanyl-D-alanine carboxypeptidase/D-alanyl-D-alanine-endopeptidase [Algiphilus sp.]|uniref:D-alanyl-D-alanine carboxypeptidase/D-alanyl-D-alanine endopeptidase n=1 Tax=Algiphilus sp. TaxID=1872431 RepID=UPI0025C35B80|nr:D-alanyl-D-alanine carboxypeptidase/D-alanyl-D-alanine-endopeptidase [Algiphilus sp.]